MTRLHARYEKGDLGEDLVLRAAAPIAGGREHIVTGGRLERVRAAAARRVGRPARRP